MTQQYLIGVATGILAVMVCLGGYTWWQGRKSHTSLLSAVAERLEALARFFHALAVGMDEAGRVWQRAKGARLTYRKPRAEAKNAEV